MFATYAFAIGTFFNYAPIMGERNNHGHAVLLWLANFGRRRQESGSGAAHVRDVRRAGQHRRQHTRAPDGENDDRADGFTLAVCGRLKVMARQMGDGDLPCVLVEGKVDYILMFWSDNGNSWLCAP